jgi:hypothetical protein
MNKEKDMKKVFFALMMVLMATSMFVPVTGFSADNQQIVETCGKDKASKSADEEKHVCPAEGECDHPSHKEESEKE